MSGRRHTYRLTVHLFSEELAQLERLSDYYNLSIQQVIRWLARKEDALTTIMGKFGAKDPSATKKSTAKKTRRAAVSGRKRRT